MSQHSVFVIDDDEGVRDSLLTLLRGEGIRARCFSSASDFFAHLPDAQSACVITDVRMPDIDGAEVVHRLSLLTDHDWPVIVITGHGDVPMAVQMMKAGVIDFIEKPFDPNRLLEAVRGCLGHLNGLTIERASRVTTERNLASLTRRERQVFERLVEGHSNKEIGRVLGISTRTVETFRATVMTKLSVESLSALVRIGILHAQSAVI